MINLPQKCYNALVNIFIYRNALLNVIVRFKRDAI